VDRYICVGKFARLLVNDVKKSRYVLLRKDITGHNGTYQVFLKDIAGHFHEKNLVCPVMSRCGKDITGRNGTYQVFFAIFFYYVPLLKDITGRNGTYQKK